MKYRPCELKFFLIYELQISFGTNGKWYKSVEKSVNEIVADPANGMKSSSSFFSPYFDSFSRNIMASATPRDQQGLN